MIRAEVLEHWVLQILERVVFTVPGMRRIADAIAKGFENEDARQAEEQAKLTQRKAAAEKKLNNIYKLFEEGDADEFDRQRLNQVKAELREINKAICETSVKPVQVLTKEKITSVLLTLKREIFVNNNKKYAQRAVDLLVERIVITDKVIKVTLSTKNVYTYLVPRTGIEPVRVSLPEGF